MSGLRPARASYDAGLGGRMTRIEPPRLRAPMKTCSIRTLGTFHITVAGRDVPPPSTHKARAIAVYLAMRQGRDVARERLIDQFWPEFSVENARASLNTALYSIRRGFRQAGLDPDDFVVADKSVVRWVAETTTDADELAAFAKTTESLDHALLNRLYPGEFLEGQYDDWSVGERGRLSAIFEQLLSRTLEKRPDVGAARELATRDPFDEKAHRILIDAELAVGRRQAAIEIARKFKASLAEVGEVPSGEFTELFEKLERSAQESAPELRLAFAGRHAEIAAIQQQLTDAAQVRGSVAIISGEPGIGKTTLLRRGVEMARNAGLRVVEAGGVFDDPRPVGPWLDVFREVTGADPSTLASAGSLVNALCAQIVDELSTPAVLVIDDAQWLDGDAAEAAVKIASLASARGHMVLMSTRPEGVGRLELLAESARAMRTRLKPLSESDLSTAFRGAGLISNNEFISAIFRRTAGQPMFAEHVLKSLVARGAIHRRHRAWQARSTVDVDRALPRSLADILTARLRSAGANAVAVAGALAIEPAADPTDLMAVLEADEESVMDGLDDLLRFEIIVQPPDGSPYAFSHELMREATVSGVSRARRAIMHRRFAQVLERRAGPDISYRRALHLGSSGDTLLAADAMRVAAFEALNWRAYVTALERCQAGIRLAASVEQDKRVNETLARLYRVQGIVHAHAGNHKSSVNSITRAVEFARETGDDALLAAQLLIRVPAYSYVYRFDEALADAAAGLTLGRRCGDSALEANALSRLAGIHILIGNVRKAEQAARTSVQIAKRIDDRWVAFNGLCVLLEGRFTGWDFDGITNLADELVESAVPFGNMTHATGLLLVARMRNTLERFDEVDEALGLAEELFETSASGKVRDRNAGIASEQLRFDLQHSRAEFDALRGRWDAALARCSKLAGLLRGSAEPHLFEVVRLTEIDALLGRGGADATKRAATLADELDPTVRLFNYGWSDCQDLAIARVAARLQRPNARQLLREAFATLERNADRRPLVADRSFALLTAAAREVGDNRLADRAERQFQDLRTARRSAAGSLWGGPGK